MYRFKINKKRKKAFHCPDSKAKKGVRSIKIPKKAYLPSRFKKKKATTPIRIARKNRRVGEVTPFSSSMDIFFQNHLTGLSLNRSGQEGTS